VTPPRRLAYALLFAIAALAAACNIGPQPLPPGAEDDRGGAVVDSSNSDGGIAAPAAGEDAGAFSGDAGAPTRDGGGDAAVDGGGDAGSQDAGTFTNDR
jgi:hypothetical protein